MIKNLNHGKDIKLWIHLVLMECKEVYLVRSGDREEDDRLLRSIKGELPTHINIVSGKIDSRFFIRESKRPFDFELPLIMQKCSRPFYFTMNAYYALGSRFDDIREVRETMDLYDELVKFGEIGYNADHVRALRSRMPIKL